MLNYINALHNCQHGFRALINIPPAKPLPDPLPPPPEIPLSYLGHLAQQIDTSTLDYAGQSAMVLDMKKGFSDPETAEDTLELLKKLRKRRDLYATFAEEIDELVANHKKVPAETLNVKEPTKKTNVRESEKNLKHNIEKPPPDYLHVNPPMVEQRTQSVVDTQPTSSNANYTTAPPCNRWLGALIAALLGAALGVTVVLTTTHEWAWGLLTGAGGAVAIVITGTYPQAIVGLLIGAAVGIFLVMSIGNSPEPFPAGVVFGAPPGAILGAIAGRFLIKPKA